jgi:hypothetical protein
VLENQVILVRGGQARLFLKPKAGTKIVLYLNISQYLFINLPGHFMGKNVCVGPTFFGIFRLALSSCQTSVPKKNRVSREPGFFRYESTKKTYFYTNKRV